MLPWRSRKSQQVVDPFSMCDHEEALAICIASEARHACFKVFVVPLRCLLHLHTSSAVGKRLARSEEALRCWPAKSRGG